MLEVFATNAAGWVSSAVLIWFLYIGLEPEVRARWPKSIVTWSRFTAQEGGAWQDHSIVSFAFYLLIFTVLTFVILRLGLVSTMVAIFFANVLLQTPGAQTLSKPYEWTVIAYPALALAIVAWAFWRTSGHRLLELKQETSLSQAATS
jgi:hypothetical protein